MIRKLLLALLFLTLSALAVEPPKMFQRLDFEAAKAQAKEQKRWLLVDATASWCPPCHQMDATTWIDAKVEDFAGQKLVAIQIDVDEQEELAGKLGIKAMPTVIVIGPDGELDRIVGYKTPEELLAWLTDLGQGKTQADALRVKAASGDIEARYDLASYLLDSGKAKESEDLYIALWTDMADSSWSGVRHSYLLDNLADLAQQSPTAKDRLEKLRTDAYAEKNFEDWFFLSKTLGHDSELLAWEPEEPLSPTIQDFYFGYLVENSQLEKAGKLIDDPAAKARDYLTQRAAMLESANDMEGEMKDEIATYAAESTMGDLLSLYAACRAAGREEDALAVRKIAVDDNASMAADFDALDASTNESTP